MLLTYFEDLSQSFNRLLDELDDYNVIIEVGTGSTLRRFAAHSVILRARSLYFKTALSSRWAKKQGGYYIFSKPNVDPDVFKLILRYIYTGTLSLSQQQPTTLLSLIVSLDELLLFAPLHDVETYLIDHHSDVLLRHAVSILSLSARTNSFSILREHIYASIVANPTILFDSEDLGNLEEEILMDVIQNDKLKVERRKIWKCVITWARKNVSRGENEADTTERDVAIMAENRERECVNEHSSELQKHMSPRCNSDKRKNLGKQISRDPRSWSDEVLERMKDLVKPFLEFVRFEEMTPQEYELHVRIPYKELIPPDMDEVLLSYFISLRPSSPQLYNSQIQFLSRYQSPMSGSMSNRSRILTRAQFQQVISWIQHVSDASMAGLYPKGMQLLLRASEDGFDPSTFRTLCGSHPGTIVVYKVFGSQTILGGYNPLPWSSCSNNGKHYRSTANAFIFSFSGNRYACLRKVENVNRAVCFNHGGPCFGRGDLCMSNKKRGICYQRDYTNPLQYQGDFVTEEVEAFSVTWANIRTEATQRENRCFRMSVDELFGTALM
ncbi:4065_t:CDS:2 [Paraglomus occultum]|uniref:4065_t:CDS:1 n=1 Tax=Paraglomus occultum TaxID=144539 RepID=A0A9N9FD39_9GLOM|nr:4065_t:CDS:2 [Paraglomus occultum]